MRGVFAIGIILSFCLVIGKAAKSSYYCQYTSATDKKIIFTLDKEKDTVSKIYAKGKSATCGSDKTGFVTGAGTLADPMKIIIDLTKPIAECGFTKKGNSYTITIVTQEVGLILKSSDKQYPLTCDMTTPSKSKAASVAGITIANSGTITDGTATKVEPKTKMELLDQSTSTPTKLTAAKIGTKVSLKFTLTSAASGGPTGIWINNCVAGTDDTFKTQFKFLGEKGCGVADAGIIDGKTGFKGSSDGAVAESPKFSMFQFPGVTTIAFRCTVNYCLTKAATRCKSANQCVTSRRKRSLELFDVLRVKRASGDESRSISVSKTFLVRLDDACQAPAQSGNTKGTKDCLTSVGFLTTAVVLAALVIISLAAVFLMYRKAINVPIKQ